MFDWWTFFFQTLNFFVVLFILYRLFFNPLRNVIRKREETIGERLLKLQEAEERLREGQAACDEKMKTIENLRERTLDEARKEALTEKDALMKEASQEMAKAFEKQQGILDQEREKYAKEIRRQSLEFGLFYTKKLLGGLCDALLHEERVARFLKALSEEDAAAFAPLRSALEHRPCDAVLHTPFPLQEPTRQKIETALKTLLGCDSVVITVVDDPSLLCGIRLEVGNRILDGSLKEELERFGNEMTGETA